jgi:hypothetical protein
MVKNTFFILNHPWRIIIKNTFFIILNKSKMGIVANFATGLAACVVEFAIGLGLW